MELLIPALLKGTVRFYCLSTEAQKKMTKSLDLKQQTEVYGDLSFEWFMDSLKPLVKAFHDSTDDMILEEYNKKFGILKSDFECEMKFRLYLQDSDGLVEEIDTKLPEVVFRVPRFDDLNANFKEYVFSTFDEEIGIAASNSVQLFNIFSNEMLKCYQKQSNGRATSENLITELGLTVNIATTLCDKNGRTLNEMDRVKFDEFILVQRILPLMENNDKHHDELSSLSDSSLTEPDELSSLEDPGDLNFDELDFDDPKLGLKRSISFTDISSGKRYKGKISY